MACALLAWGWCSSLHAPSNCLDLDAFYVLGETPLDELYFEGDHNTPLSIDFSFMISWEQGELHNLRGYEIFFYPPLLQSSCRELQAFSFLGRSGAISEFIALHT